MLSVIICTYNNVGKLRQALKSLADMSTPAGLQWELIVVDNNSSDGTREVVRKSKKSFGLNIKYVFEGKQGLSNARNRGMLAATGEYVAFTDDDCIVDKYWLLSIHNEFQNDPELALLGGRVELYDKRDKAVTVRTFKDRILFTSPSQLFTLLPGCNMVFKRNVFNDVGKFDPGLGAGTRTASAEDSDFFYQAFRKGYKLLYSPTVLVYHNHGRRTDAQVKALNKGYVIGRGAFYCKHILRADNVVLRMAALEIMGQIRAFIRDLCNRNPVHKPLRMCYFLTLGALYRLTGIRHFERDESS